MIIYDIMEFSDFFMAISIDCPPPPMGYPDNEHGDLIMNNIRFSGFRRGLLYAVSAVVLAQSSVFAASFTFLGPTPYLSAADSPFAAYLGGPDFFLEDFEDGQLNSLGIYQRLHPYTHGIVRGPGSDTNSVDSDDGIIDGEGLLGHSLASNFYWTDLVDPPTIKSYLRFSFDDSLLGFLPNSFGFVWTSGAPNSRISIDLKDGDFNTVAIRVFEPLEVNSPSDSFDDRFFGVYSSGPIVHVEIIATYRGNPEPVPMEIDHVQYGLIVPEPTSIALIAVGMVLGLSRRSNRFIYPSR